MSPWDVNSAISGTLYLELPLTILKAFQAKPIPRFSLSIVPVSG
jgi:hypothetical protein